ncbi:rpsU-divergently transcribed [Lecanosticta acicola]|uniref:RpsU-divergently transcribed n=1 Tax=Lecanosticta acicola TaxID=111012 RepID=A0AAI8YZV0_9PEZI|nr:rpsU-divergently transcribed [Lecanosticta acicola]
MAATPTATGAEWSTAISNRDHGPLVTITVCLMLVATFLFMGFRMTIRWPWSKLVGYDDMATIIGSLFACAQSTAVLISVHRGLGKHRADLGEAEAQAAIKAAWISDIISVLALTGSKLAVSLLILRLSTFKKHVLAARVVSILIGIWGVPAVVMTSLQRASSQERNRDGWIGVGVYSVLLEIALIVLPVYLVWNLQMRLSAKVTVVVGFLFRIPATALAVARVYAVVKMFSVESHDSSKSMTDFTWLYVNPTIFTTIEMHYSLLAATIPCMHLFLRQFSTGYMGTTNAQLQGTMLGSKGNLSDSYALSSTRSRQGGFKRSRRGGTERQYSDIEAVSRALYQVSPAVTTVSASRENRPDSVASDGSEKIMVRQTVDVKWQDSNEDDAH